MIAVVVAVVVSQIIGTIWYSSFFARQSCPTPHKTRAKEKFPSLLI
jgi:hypothetical protein